MSEFYSKNYDLETLPLPFRYRPVIPLQRTATQRRPPLPYRPAPLHNRSSPSTTVTHRSSPLL